MKSKDLNFEYMEDFVDYIVEEVENNEDLFLTVVGKFEEIKEIVKEMMIVADVDFENIKLESPDVDGYEDEYVLDCWCSDGVVEIGCEPAKRDGGYLNLGGDEIYLLENVSSKIIPLCEGSDLYFVNMNDEHDCNEDCDCPCEHHRDECCVEYTGTEDGDIYGFMISESTGDGCYSYSFYTMDTLSEDEIRSILKKFGF